MKTNLLRTSIAAVLAATAVYAQGSHSLKANVPFDFVVGNHTLRAGYYTVESGDEWRLGDHPVRREPGRGDRSYERGPFGSQAEASLSGIPSLRKHVLPLGSMGPHK